MIKTAILTLYSSFLMTRHKFSRPILLCILLTSLVIGAGYRIIEVKKNFKVINGFEFFVNMASHFWTQPGGYNFEESLKIKEMPDDYVFSRHPKVHATGSFENEKGWAFILSLIFKEGAKGIQNLARTVVRYQLMLDLFVVVLLFYSGKSIAGPLGGSLAAILYALFKPSVSMMSWVVYYYWAIPFSALSLFFWTVIYKPETKTYSLRYSSLLFFMYGMVIGFATSVRLGFLFLPLFLSPLIFFRERAFKRSLVLVLAMLIGHGILLMPQFFITYKYYDKFTLSVRGQWHGIINGLGAYPNPFGIKDSADLTGVNWAIERGGPDLNKAGIQEYDKFMKKEAIRLFKERPDIFLRNFKTNLYAGITMTTKDNYTGGPIFYKIMDSDKEILDPKIIKFAYSFPYLVFFSILMLLIFWQDRFWQLISVTFQGFYILAVLCIYFPPVTYQIAAYLPTFVLLLAVAPAVLFKGVISIPDGILRCWVNDKGVKDWPNTIRECFHEEWDKEYSPTQKKQFQSISVANQRISPSIKWFIVFLGVVIIFIAGLDAAIRIKHIPDKKIDDKTVQMIENILKPETNGGFESWSNGESSLPDGWGFMHGKGSRIQKAAETGNIKFGVSSAEVWSGSFEDSKLFFGISSDKLYYLIGKTITITGWAKSNNKIRSKAYIFLYTGVNTSQYLTYYQNSGEWEKLTLTYKIPDDITTMAIVLSVDNGADFPVYFDGIEMKIAE